LRITVTGATGFIGSQLVDRLLADGHQVTALVRQPSSIPPLTEKGVTAVVGDVTDNGSLATAMTGADLVFHLARARAHGALPREAFRVNAEGSRNVARAAMAAGARRVVHASSSTVYGSRVGLVREEAVLRPDSAYARSKADAEKAMKAEAGDRAVIARITAVMGPGAGTWKPLATSAAAGTLRLVGSGSNMHHPADVSDILHGLIRCAFTDGIGGRTYNLAGPEPVSVADLREHLARAAAPGRAIRHPRSYPALPITFYYRLGVFSDRVLGFRPPLFESVTFLTADRMLDIARARKDLGFAPKVGVAQAAIRTMEWLRSTGADGGEAPRQ
jgi:nucleoside-diphosphate-sugar epimerase